jgi:hypothetical protein
MIAQGFSPGLSRRIRFALIERQAEGGSRCLSRLIDTFTGQIARLTINPELKRWANIKRPLRGPVTIHQVS